MASLEGKGLLYHGCLQLYKTLFYMHNRAGKAHHSCAVAGAKASRMGQEIKGSGSLGWEGPLVPGLPSESKPYILMICRPHPSTILLPC